MIKRVHELVGFAIGVVLFFPALSVYNTLVTAPVVENMKVTNTYKQDGKRYIRVIGDKVRDCGPPISITGSYGSSIFRSIHFLDDVEKGVISLPDAQPVKSDIDFRWWELDPEPADKDWSGEALFSVFHSCRGKAVETKFILEIY